MSDEVLTAIIGGLFSLLSIAVTAAIPWLLRKAKGAGLEVTEAQERQLRSVIRDAIDYAEESAHRAVKERRGELTSEEKLRNAKRFAKGECSRLGIRCPDDETLRRKIESTVGIGRPK